MEVPSTTTGVLSRNPRAGGRSGAGRRRGRRDRRWRGRAASRACCGAARRNRPRHRQRRKRLRPRLTPVTRIAATSAPIKLDPFFEVRTPERNFGPARLAGGITVTPLARRLAGEAGIDLSRLRGSGPHGRIVARDVEDAPRPCARAPRLARTGPSAAEIKALYAPGSYEEVPLDGMRRTIAARLTQAAQTIPHFYLTADIDIDRLIALREEANAGRAQGQGRQSGIQALGQRFRHPRAGAGACSACRRPMRSGPATASCASSIPTSASRWRSTAA